MSSPDASEPDLCCPLVDDANIPDDAVLFRRLPQWHLTESAEAATGYRPTSNSFQDCDPMGVSVYFATELEALGLEADDLLTGVGSGLWGVALTTAGQARRSGFGVRLRPDPDQLDDPRNDAHGELTGLLRSNPGGKQSKKLSKPPTAVVQTLLVT